MTPEKPGPGSRPPITRRAEKESEGRLRPGSARKLNTAVPRSERGATMTGTARRLLRLARQVSRVRGQRSGLEGRESFSRQFNRRVIVNVRYASAKTRGAWRAHGKYVERESAAGERGRRDEDRLGLAGDQFLDQVAQEWQAAGDPRIFKIIISPEEGARADFRRTAGELMEALEQYIGSKLEWAGVVHRNTDHPHAHLIIRGVKEDGTPFTIPPAVVKSHLREAVQRSLTRQLGHRTWEDVQHEREAETSAFRVTSLDRAIGRNLPSDAAENVRVAPQNAVQRRRLQTLQRMGLAQAVNGHWEIRSDFQKQLQRMKDLQDRARTLFQSGVAISDPHAPMEYLERSRKLIGRVLLTSEEDRSGRLQTAFETIDGKIIIVKHDSTLRDAWVRGDLKAGNVVMIDALRRDPHRLYASVIGNDRNFVNNEKALDSLVRRIRNMSLILTENDKGWMGQLSKAVAERRRGSETEL